MFSKPHLTRACWQYSKCVHVSGVNCHLGADVYRNVFNNYVPGIRPECAVGSPTTITTDFALRQIIDLVSVLNISIYNTAGHFPLFCWPCLWNHVHTSTKTRRDHMCTRFCRPTSYVKMVNLIWKTSETWAGMSKITIQGNCLFKI